MTDENKKKLGGWSVKTVLTGFAGVLSFLATQAVVDTARLAMTTLVDTHEKVTSMAPRVDAIERQLAGDRITGRMNKIDERLEKLDARLQVVEKEQARRGSVIENLQRKN